MRFRGQVIWWMIKQAPVYFFFLGAAALGSMAIQSLGLETNLLATVCGIPFLLISTIAAYFVWNILLRWLSAPPTRL